MKKILVLTLLVFSVGLNAMMGDGDVGGDDETAEKIIIVDKKEVKKIVNS